MKPFDRIAEIQASKQELTGKEREAIEQELAVLLVRVAVEPYDCNS